MTIILTGFITCLALIVAVGPQSAWQLRQGLRRDRVGLALVVSWVADTALVVMGTAGVGIILDGAPWLLEALRWLGAAYLLWFAARSFRAAFGPQEAQTLTIDVDTDDAALLATGSMPVVDAVGSEATAAGSDGNVRGRAETQTRRRAGRPTHPGRSSVRTVVLMGISVSMLNPHAWVDTLVVLGAMANSFGADRWLFAAGIALASLLWFTLLLYGGSLLSRWLSSPRVWKGIDVAVGVTMIVVAGLLIIRGL
ncbi:LysE/ArgO family amino acid transporter [Nesterenkonia marinintestina]|uniref:LysE/ArgO family amino acid transporter n=1 Tax=Nesterenkonia marinintestina TaxID=2979865 RepID=UPI0021C2264E|nr:LysE family transporter [Nesterenkonia sp. GX14115]